MPRRERNRGFRWSVRIRFGDTDPFGVVYFASYFRYMKEALDEFLRARGLPPERTYRDAEAGRAFPVVASRARFLAPARYGDVLAIRVRVDTHTDKAITFGFRMATEPDGKSVAQGQITCVAINRQWRAIAIPTPWRESLLGGRGSPGGHQPSQRLAAPQRVDRVRRERPDAGDLDRQGHVRA
jgi:acyl-CoA thioester hydrolase